MKKNNRSRQLLFLILLIVLLVLGCKQAEDEGDTGPDTPGADTTAPTITDTNPGDSSIDVPPNTHISVTFSEAMDDSTITANTVDTICSGSLQVSSDNFSSCVKMSDISTIDNITFTLSPAYDLLHNTSFKIKTTTSAKDSSDNPLASEFITSRGFTTGQDTTAPTVADVSPADHSYDSSQDILISVTFSETMGTSTIVTNTVDSSCSGSFQVSKDFFATCVQMLDSPSAANKSKTFTIKPAYRLLPYSIYVIKITTSAKDSSENALALEYKSRFMTGQDTTAPTVTSVIPTDGSAEVSSRTTISVTFSEEMDGSTITTNTDNAICSGSLQVFSDSSNSCVQMSADPSTTDNKTFSISPTSDLSHSTTYRIKIATSAKDSSENALISEYITSTGFTVNPDITAPTVTNVSPGDGSADIPPQTTISVTFSEAIDSSTLSLNTSNSSCSGSFQLSDNDFATCVKMVTDSTADNHKKTFNLTPEANLTGETTYQIKITSAVGDLTGNLLSSEYFTNNGFTTDKLRKLPDTDQTTDYTSTFGEDSDYTINPPSYADNGDETVADNNTQLMWQQESDNSERIWDDAKLYCNDLKLGDYNDWRLPNLKELLSIVNYDSYSPSIDQSYFTNTESSSYWSSITYSKSNQYAWNVNFKYGYAIQESKTGSSNHVRCVRGAGENLIWRFDFVRMSEGTIRHNGTALTWQQEGLIQTTWESAIAWCEELSLAGYTDWRLPSIKELISITPYSTEEIELYRKEELFGQHPGYWSSTTTISDWKNSAWITFFQENSVNRGPGSADKGSSRYVRCVRGGQ